MLSVPSSLILESRGQVEKQLTAEITKNEFTLRLLQAINMFENTPNPSPSQQSSQPTLASGTLSSQPTSGSPDPGQGMESTLTSSPEQPRSPMSNPEDMTNDRRVRVELQQAQRQAREKAEEAKTRERARVRREQAEAANTASPEHNQIPSQRSYAQEQVKRKKEAQAERQRILKQIEHDKQERKEREEQRRAATSNNASIENNATAVVPPPPRTSASMPSSARLQVRLLDGSTIRDVLPSDTKLSSVRDWIDRSRTDGDHPYTLKQLLTPAPSRTLSLVDEAETLQALKLLPSATLILSPVQGLAAAYQQRPGNAAGTIMSLFWGKILAIFFSFLGMMKTFLGIGDRRRGDADETNTFTVGDAGSRQANATSVNNLGSSTNSSLKIRTLKDQRDEKAKEEQQLYNGNQASVQHLAAKLWHN